MFRHVSQTFTSTDTITLKIAREKIYLPHSGAETVLLWEASSALSPLKLRNIKITALISICKYYTAAVQDVSVAAALAGKGYRSNIKPPEICTNTVGKASVVAALVKKGCGVCLRLLVLIRCRGQQVGCFILNVLSLLSRFIPLMVSCLKMFLAHKLLMLAKPVTHTRSRVPTPSKTSN